jgi:hypothetical protein
LPKHLHNLQFQGGQRLILAGQIQSPNPLVD